MDINSMYVLIRTIKNGKSEWIRKKFSNVSFLEAKEIRKAWKLDFKNINKVDYKYMEILFDL